MSDCSFRLATVDDIGELLPLLETLFSQEREFCFDATKQIIALTMLIEKQMGDIIAVEFENKIVGMLTVLYTISTALGGKVAILEDMVIDPNFQGQSFGSKLLRYTIDYLEENHIKRITLLTDNDNCIAHKFYETNGFKRSSMITFRKILR